MQKIRYGSILSLDIDDDDDANAATVAPKQVPQPKPQPKVVPKAERIIVSEGDETFLKIVKAVSEGKATIQQAIDKYSISEEVEASLKDKIQLLAQIV
jgi:alpha-galactosidase